jgi:hypothetical protein
MSSSNKGRTLGFQRRRQRISSLEILLQRRSSYCSFLRKPCLNEELKLTRRILDSQLFYMVGFKSQLKHHTSLIGLMCSECSLQDTKLPLRQGVTHRGGKAQRMMPDAMDISTVPTKGCFISASKLCEHCPKFTEIYARANLRHCNDYFSPSLWCPFPNLFKLVR